MITTTSNLNNPVTTTTISKSKNAQSSSKADSAKQKTKSNSITSNVSNPIVSNGNTLGKNLIKNYNINKNPTKISNVSYLNMKNSTNLKSYGDNNLAMSNEKVLVK